YELIPGDYFIFDLRREYICTHNPGNPLCVYAAEFHILDKQGNKTILNLNSIPSRIRMDNMHLQLGLWENAVNCYWDYDKAHFDIWLKAILLQLITFKGKAEENKIIDNLCFEILNNPEKTFTLSYLSSKSGYSENHLIRLFKKYRNTTPHEFCMRAKIEKAKSLILYSNMSLTKISQSLNFYDINHFSKQFKKRVGVSPADYAKYINKIVY
ncbi:MAG TPA: AraC family transcriptional regulator, partial [Clostridia bacterium]|nr:AraC family transcriptional regulator [Clostridia bacterium]